MSAISKTYIRGHNILVLVDILPNVSFTASENKRDYTWFRVQLITNLTKSN